MSVCHTAFVAYGAKVTLKDDASVDDLDMWLSRTGKDLGLGFVTWGSSYTGNQGYVVGDRRCIASYDFDSGGNLASLQVDNPPIDVKDRIKRAIERGAPIRIDSGVRWWVGGSTW